MRVAFTAPEGVSVSSFGSAFKSVAEQHEIVWWLRDLASKPNVMIMVSKFDHALNDLLYRYSIGAVADDPHICDLKS